MAKGSPAITDRQSIHLRLPRALHEQLRQLAEEQGVSLNTLLVALVAGAVGFALDDEAPATSQTSGGLTASGGKPDAAAAR